MIGQENLVCFERQVADLYGTSAANASSPVSASGRRTITAVGPRLVTAAWPDSRWIIDTAGKVCDGRDWWATILIWLAVRAGLGTANAVTNQAWPMFQRTTALDRPRKDGKRPWRRTDLLEKARYLLGPRKTRVGRLVSSADGFWTPALLGAFRDAVNRRGAHRRLSPAAVRVSHTMAGYVKGDGACFASPYTLACRLGLAERTVKQARSDLVADGAWCVANNRGGRARGADYTPNPEVLLEAASDDFCVGLRRGKGEQFEHPNPLCWELSSQKEPQAASLVNPRLPKKRNNSCTSTIDGKSAPAPFDSSAASDKLDSTTDDAQRDDASHDRGDA